MVCCPSTAAGRQSSISANERSAHAGLSGRRRYGQVAADMFTAVRRNVAAHRSIIADIATSATMAPSLFHLVIRRHTIGGQESMYASTFDVYDNATIAAAAHRQ